MDSAPQQPVADSWDVIRAIMREIDADLFARFGDRVLCGPFSGMRLSPTVKWDDGNLASKLIGSYEFELRGTIEKILNRKPETIVNVGCAEGYYAIGLGKLIPESAVYAIDVDGDSLDQCEHNARNNNLQRLTTVIGKPAPQDLELGSGRHLFFVDIEGDELDLLNKELCPLLIESDIIVECHDFFNPDDAISVKLQDRFSDTHSVELIVPQVPYLGDYPFLSDLRIGTVLLAITEKRPLPTVWLACWAQPRKGI